MEEDVHKLFYGDVPNAVISDILFLNEQQNVDEFTNVDVMCVGVCVRMCY